MKFSITNSFSKYDQIRRKLRIYSHLPKKFVMENFIFCAVTDFFCGKILKIIQSLDPNKAPGHDLVSTRMLKLSIPSLLKSLSLIFDNCLFSGSFPDE